MSLKTSDYVSKDRLYNMPPLQEDLPRVIAGPKEDSRFEEIVPDYFWGIANWTYATIITLMGIVALKDMLMGTFNPLTMFCWVATAVGGLAGLAFIHKIILTK